MQSGIQVQTRHCVKYARIRVFFDPYSPVRGQNGRLCPITKKCESEKTCILTVESGTPTILSLIIAKSLAIYYTIFAFMTDENQQIFSLTRDD